MDIKELKESIEYINRYRNGGHFTDPYVIELLVDLIEYIDNLETRLREMKVRF